VLGTLGQSVGALKPSIRLLRPGAAEGTSVLRALGRAAPRLDPVLTGVRTLAPLTARALPQLKSVLCQLNQMASYLGPYDRQIAMLFADMGSATDYVDADGHAARLDGLLSDNSVTFYDKNTSKLVDTLLKGAGALLQGIQQRGYNPYPAPGVNGEPTVGRGVMGPADARGVIKFPHVTAAC
jgi:hypothetical protein